MDELKLKIRRYSSKVIYEFDSLDELREFDTSYIEDTRSKIIKDCAKKLACKEADLYDFEPLKDEKGKVYGCSFIYEAGKHFSKRCKTDGERCYYYYDYKTGVLAVLDRK